MNRRIARKIAAEPRLYSAHLLACASCRLTGGNAGTLDRAWDLLMSNHYETPRAQRYEQHDARWFKGRHVRWYDDGCPLRF